MKNNLRLFVAAPLPSELVSQLAAFLPDYQIAGVRLVPETNWHLTVFFIGNVAQPKLPEITRTLADLVLDFAPFTLKLLRVAPGPNKQHPRLVWAQFAENKPFEKLVRAVTLGLGEKIKNQHPIPHITLARLAKDRPPLRLPVSPAAGNLNFTVTEIALWQSDLGQPHPKYTVLETFKLAVST